MPIARQAGMMGAAGIGSIPHVDDPYYEDTYFWFDARYGLGNLSPSGGSFTNNNGTLTSTRWEGNGTNSNLESSFQAAVADTGDFTWEGVVEWNTNTGVALIWGTNFNSRILTRQDNNYFESIGAGSYTNVGTGKYHVALVRDGSNLVLYYNGSAVSSRSYAGNLGGSTYWIAFMGMSGQGYIDGNMYSCRFVEGTALYTSSFTPPSGDYLGIE